MTEPVNFIDRVQFGPGCWEWTGYLGTKGYPQIGVRYMHREVLEGQLGRKLRSGEMACHSCDNRRCVRPDHIWLGTAKDNSRDMAHKGRSRNQNTGKTHCKHGHSLADAFVHVRADGRIGRNCRQCVLESNRHRRSRLKVMAS